MNIVLNSVMYKLKLHVSFTVPEMDKENYHWVVAKKLNLNPHLCSSISHNTDQTPSYHEWHPMSVGGPCKVVELGLWEPSVGFVWSLYC